MTNIEMEKFIKDWLEDDTFDELLETFDVDPLDAFEVLFRAGLIDEDDLEGYKKL